MEAKIDGIQILIQRRPTSLTNRHPNLSVLLKIATTLQVTSCECECKSRFSVTRRLRTWLRAPFTTRPFSLLTEHRGVEIDYRRYSEDSSSVPLTKVRRVKFSI